MDARYEWKRLPSDVLDAFIAESFTSTSDVRRLLVSYSNDIYEIDADGETFILRAHRGEPNHFDGERWALDQTRALGCRVPEIVAGAEVEGDGVPWSLLAHRKLRGDPLITFDRDDALADSHREALNEAGRCLARIHSVSTSGLGYIDGFGHGAEITWRDFNDRFDLEVLVEAARTSNIDALGVRESVELISSHAEMWDGVQARLIHGDFSSKHVLVADGLLTGVIDFEFCASGDPARDLAFWDYQEGDWGSTRVLLDGYRSIAPTDENIERRMALLRLAVSLDYIAYHAPRNELDGPFRDEIVHRLTTDVERARAIL